MKKIISIMLAVTLLSGICLSCKIAEDKKSSVDLTECPKHDIAVLESLKNDIDNINLDYSPTEYQKQGYLVEKWSIESSGIYDDYISAIDKGWVFSDWDNVLSNIDDPSKEVVFVTNPENGERFSDSITRYYGLVRLREDLNFLNANHKYIQAISDEYMVVHLSQLYLVNRKSGEVESIFENGRQVINTENNVYCSSGSGLTKVNLNNPSEPKLIPGSFANVYVIDNELWLLDGSLYLIDEENFCVKDSVHFDTIIDLDIPISLENIPASQMYNEGLYENYILGRIVNHDALVEKYHCIKVPNYCYFTQYTYPISNIKNVYPAPKSIDAIKYVLCNPNNPDVYYEIDEDLLGTMDAVIRLKNNHFIVENDKVLKCINPFEQKDIWWISREDVGEQAKILWADERGVLVYSMTHKKLYCFE